MADLDPAVLEALALQQQQAQQPPLNQMSAALAQPPVPQNQAPDPLAIAAAARSVGNTNADSAPSFAPQANTTPVLAGSPGSAEAANQGLRPGRPLLLDTMQRLIRPPMVAPAPGQIARPESRLDTFENFLGNFLNAFGQGMSQSGQRGANFKGFGAAIAAPRATNVANQQLQNQTDITQAEAAERQAQAGQIQAQTRLLGTSVPLTLPNGQQIFVPASQLGQYLKGGYAAGVSGQYGVQKQEAANQGRLNAIQLQTQIMAGKASKFIPDMGQNGQPFYHVMNPFGQEIGQADVSAIPQLMQRTSSTIQWVQGEDGTFQPLPKSTTTGPVIPGVGAPANTPSGFPRGGVQPAPGGKHGAAPFRGPTSTDMVIGSVNGQQIAVPRSAMSQFKWDQGMSPTKAGAAETEKITNARTLLPQFGKALNLVDQLNQSGQIGSLISRWNQLASKNVGDGDPRFTALLAQMGLNETGLMQVHVGARGSSQLLEHFHDLANSGKMDYPNLRAALLQEQNYIHDKAMLPPVSTGTGQQGGKTSGGFNWNAHPAVQ